MKAITPATQRCNTQEPNNPSGHPFRGKFSKTNEQPTWLGRKTHGSQMAAIPGGILGLPRTPSGADALK